MLNYELNLRGRNQIKTGSQNIVLNKSTDLIRNNFEQLRKFKKQAKDIQDVKQQWSNKMEEIEKEGMSLKEAASLTQERKKLKDLEYLKAQIPPGPFTSADDQYMKAEVDEKEKNECLNIEVRYAKMTTSNMKTSSAVFRLKKDYKNLDSEDYAHNLRVYFGCVNAVNTISLSDFSYILTGLNAACSSTAVPTQNTSSSTEVPTENTSTEPEKVTKTVQTGEHIAGVWADDNDATGRILTWHIGIVESDDGGAVVSYLVQTNSNNKANWMYPESASTFYTPYDQIIANNLSVEYRCVTIIRCRITRQQLMICSVAQSG